MKAFILTLTTIIIFTATTIAQRSQTLTIRQGQQRTVTGLKIKFVSVPEDSRCPENARCIWAGVGRVNIELRGNGKPAKTFELNTNQLDKTAIYNGFEIKLKSLTPYPKTQTPVSPARYIATFTVEKK